MKESIKCELHSFRFNLAVITYFAFRKDGIMQLLVKKELMGKSRKYKIMDDISLDKIFVTGEKDVYYFITQKCDVAYGTTRYKVS